MHTHTLYSNEKYKNEHFVVIHEWDLTEEYDTGHELAELCHSEKKASTTFRRLVREAKKSIKDDLAWIVTDDWPDFFSAYHFVNKSFEVIRLIHD